MKSISFRKILLSAIIIVIAWLSFTCKTIQPAFDAKNLSYLYNPLKNSLNPRYSILNQSDEVSSLSVKFFTSDLYFNEANPRGIPMSMLYISVRLFNTTLGRSIVDTSAFDIDIVKDGSRDEYIYNIPLKVEKGFDYVAEVKIIDKIRQQMVQGFVPFNTISDNSRYNFYARGHFVKNELLNPIVRQDEYLNLIYTRKPIDSLFVSFFKPLEGVPYPPSMVLPERTLGDQPDAFVAIPYSDTVPMMFPRKGVYLCTTGRDITEGYSFMNFGPSFPALTTPEEMFEPLASIASEDEMIALQEGALRVLTGEDHAQEYHGKPTKA